MRNPGYLSVGETLFLSTDGGVTWAPTPSQPVEHEAIRSLAISSQGIWAAAGRAGLFRSTDGGAHWTATGPPHSVPLKAVAVSPASPSTLYLGVALETDIGGVFVSRDSGASWARRNRGLPGLMVTHVTAESLSGEPAQICALLPYSGLFRSPNGGQRWAPALVRPSPDFVDYGELHAFAADPRILYLLLGGGRETRLWRSTDGCSSWTEIQSPPGFPAKPSMWKLSIDPIDSSRLWAIGNGLLTSRDGGSLWEGRTILQGFCELEDLAIAPSSPATLYAAGSQSVSNDCRNRISTIFRSRSYGRSWITVGYPAHGDAFFARLLAVDPADPDLVYAATSGGRDESDPGLWKSTNGGVTWRPIGQESWTKSIDRLFSTQPGVVWAMTGYFATPRIFCSRDAGKTWQDLLGNLQADHVYELAADPANLRRIYAATSNGVWLLDDD